MSEDGDGELRIDRAGSERLADLQPLWESLHHHHAAVAPELRRLGVRHLGVGVIAANADAIRFYERLGLLRFMVSYIGNVPEPPRGP